MNSNKKCFSRHLVQEKRKNFLFGYFMQHSWNNFHIILDHFFLASFLQSIQHSFAHLKQLKKQRKFERERRWTLSKQIEVGSQINSFWNSLAEIQINKYELYILKDIQIKYVCDHFSLSDSCWHLCLFPLPNIPPYVKFQKITFTNVNFSV